MIDNNIAQSLGVGSGIDTNNLITQLTDIERAAPQNRIDSTRETTETKISDFGLLSSALSVLQESAQVLVEPEGLFSKTASFTESTALVPASLDTDVQAGIYNFTVEDIAQSQALAFTEFSSVDDAVGEGTITFNFGTWIRDGSDVPTGFTQDTEQDAVTITIDSSNNTLEGLRDAINNADFGVQANIVNTGSGFKLSLLAASGAGNEIEMVVAEAGGTPSNTDTADLSRFAFNTGVADFADVETQKGNDAQLTLNGLTVFRSSNTVTDLVEGLTLDVLQAAPGETVTVTVEEDKTFAEQNIRDFIGAYNEFLNAVDPLFDVSTQINDAGEEESVVGSLANDSLAKSVLSRIRSTIASAIPGLGNSNFTSLTNVGIRTELDGSLSINEEEFTDAFADRFEDVQKLFAPQTDSSSSDISVNSFKDSTAAGDYDIVISTPPSQGYLTGGAIDNGAVTFPNFDTSGKDYSFEVSVNGTASSTITLPSATYADENALAAAIQSAVNADSELAANNAKITVGYDADNNNFVLSSTQYGTSSNVNITAASDDTANDLGLAISNGTAGVAVSGTINGVAGFGSANVLLPALGEPGEGLALIIGENASSATVNFSRGFAGELDSLIDIFLESDGVIAAREESLTSTLDSLDEDQEALDRRMSTFEARLLNQFISMERILSGLDSSGSFLENLIDTLPFTSSNN